MQRDKIDTAQAKDDFPKLSVSARVRLKNEELRQQVKEQRRIVRLSSNRMPKALKFSTSKLILIVFMLAVQLAVLVVGFVILRSYINATVLLITEKMAAVLFAVYIINAKIPNEYKLIWVIVVLFLTGFGMAAYVIFGRKSLTKRKRKQLGRKIDNVLAQCVQDEKLLDEAQRQDSFLCETAQYIYANGKMPLGKSDEAKYFSIGEDFFEQLKAELSDAKKFIFMEYFIIGEGRMWEELFEILSQKARNGLDVRIIYDDFGSLPVLPKRFGKNCLDAGIKLYCFNRVRPVLDVAQNNRTHRKITVIDGKCAFTGGLNIADEYINLVNKHGYWKDTGVMIKGGAVANFTRMFLINWAAKYGKEDFSGFMPTENERIGDEGPGSKKRLRNSGNGIFCVPFCDTPGTGRTICESLYIKMIYNAKKYVYINTPYLIISEKVRDALITAAESGIDVRITVPHVPDKKFVFALTRAFYMPLVLAGVKVYEFKPGFVHAKSMVSDDKYVVIGSSNMDFRSFYLHYECDIFMYKGIAKELRADYEETCGYSILITQKQVESVSFIKRVIAAVLRLFAPLM